MTINLPVAVEWPALFAEYLIKTTLVLSMCLLLVSFFRGRTAAIRHFLLSFFLIGLLLLPVVSTFPFGWETDLLPARLPVSITQGVRDWSGPSKGGYAGSKGLFSKPRALRPTAASAPAANAPQELESPSAPALLRILGSMLPLVWSAGLAFLVLRFSLAILGACRLTHEGKDVTDAAWRVLLARCIAAIRIKRTVRLKSHSAIGVPITWGLLKPVILIPRGHGEWTEDQRSSVLLHELCHIKRADLLVMFLVRLSLAVYWFNPLCWIASRRLQQEQERACDELVLTAGIKPSTYAATLLFFKRTAGVRHDVPAAFVGLFGSASFDGRLAAILRQKLTLKEDAMKTRITLAIAVMLAVSLIGMARPPKTLSESPSNLNLPILALQSPMPPAHAAAQALAGQDQDVKVDALQDQAKKKEEQKPTIIVRNPKGEKIPIEIKVVTGDTARTLRVEKPLTIKEGKEGELILLDPAGKEMEILKGEPLRLTTEGKDLVIVKEGDLLKIDKAGTLSLMSSKDLSGAVKVHVVPGVKIQKSGEGPVKFIMGVKGRDQAPVLKENLKAIILKQIQSKEKQVAVADLKPATKVLVAKLAKEEVQKSIQAKLQEKFTELRLAKPLVITRAGSGIRIMKDPGKRLITIQTGDAASLSIMFGLSPGVNVRGVYDRIVAGVRQALPENYAVEPGFDEKSGAVTLKITGSGMPKVPTDLIKKILDVIETEIK